MPTKYKRIDSEPIEVGLTTAPRASLTQPASVVLQFLGEEFDYNDTYGKATAEVLLFGNPLGPRKEADGITGTAKDRLRYISKRLEGIGYTHTLLDFDALRAKADHIVRVSSCVVRVTTFEDAAAFSDAIRAIRPWNPDWIGGILFDRFLWKPSKSDSLRTPAELTLEMLDEIDKDRRRFERLRRIHIDGHPRNAPARESIPEGTRAFVFRRDGGRCVGCGADKDLHFDHIIPVTKGGGNHPDNLQLLCEPCNLKKSDTI